MLPVYSKRVTTLLLNSVTTLKMRAKAGKLRVLQQVASEINQITDPVQQSNVAASTAIAFNNFCIAVVVEDFEVCNSCNCLSWGMSPIFKVTD